MVVLDEDGQVIRPAMLWNDLRSAAAARALIAELGGPGWWARAHRQRAQRLVHRDQAALAGRARAGQRGPGGPGHAAARLADLAAAATGPAGRDAEPVTDRGDASGTGYFSPADGRWLPEVAAAALGHQPGLPRIAKPAEVVGETGTGAALAPGTGDNMGAALGLGLDPGRAGHLDRHLGHRLRGHRAARRRRVRHGGRVRRRHRPVPAADRHGQRGPGAVRGGRG